MRLSLIIMEPCTFVYVKD